jgi:flagellar assembly factor FliW
MKINTKFYGEIDINDKQRIMVPKGLFGFEDISEFALLEAEQPPFYYFQSIKEKDLCFILIDPFLVRPDYEADIDQDELDGIGVKSPETAVVLSIVTALSDGSPATINLQGPLIINKNTGVGCQAVINDPRWKTKHSIIGGKAEEAGGKC